MNIIKINWVSIMVEHILKSRRLTDYKFSYVIFVSKLIDCFKVDNTNERNETIKAISEINNATFTKMDFQKEENAWVYRRNVASRMEHEASNRGYANEDDDAPHAEDEDVPFSFLDHFFKYEI